MGVKFSVNEDAFEIIEKKVEAFRAETESRINELVQSFLKEGLTAEEAKQAAIQKYKEEQASS
ncbi:MAG: hypothetical protein ACX94C_11070 [Phycisphaerales bacterium]